MTPIDSGVAAELADELEAGKIVWQSFARQGGSFEGSKGTVAYDQCMTVGKAILALRTPPAVASPAEREVPIAWRWRHKGHGEWQHAELKPTGPSIHLFDVEPLFARSPSVSGAEWNAAIERCAELVESTGLRNPDNIARDIRALASQSVGKERLYTADEVREAVRSAIAEMMDEGKIALPREAHRAFDRMLIEECAKIAELAELPEGFQWGDDATEQFNFGKKRCADAIRALSHTRGEG